VDAGGGFLSLAEPWANTGTSTGRLMLGGLADVERDLIRTRTAEALGRAKARGERTSRPPALSAHQRAEALQRLSEGASPAQLAAGYGVSRWTTGRLKA
jgi:DNA invertase Pin-like site-specific DNA recombinase